MIKYRKARHLYHILETFEAGLVLTGEQTKAVRNNKVTLQSPWVHNNQLVNVFETPVPLLLHKHELKKLEEAEKVKHLAIISLDIHVKRGRFKATIAVVKGKNKMDKRETLKKSAENLAQQQETKCKFHSIISQTSVTNIS